MAVRICPLCGGKIQSWAGQTLKLSARQHYAIVHSGTLSEEELKKWQDFYDSLPNPENPGEGNMPGCITADYKDMLVGLIAQELGAESLVGVVKAIPLCEEAKPPAREEVERAKRAVPAVWGLEPIYVDAKGKREKFSSPSALIKHLGLPMSGIQCDPEGKRCKVSSAVEILRVHGYTVSGDGEPKKAAEGGKKLTVFHPEAVKEK